MNHTLKPTSLLADINHVLRAAREAISKGDPVEADSCLDLIQLWLPGRAEEIAKRLTIVRDSSMGGFDGTWDPSGEGRDGFTAMAEDCGEISRMLGVELPEYVTEREE